MNNLSQEVWEQLHAYRNTQAGQITMLVFYQVGSQLQTQINTNLETLSNFYSVWQLISDQAVDDVMATTPKDSNAQGTGRTLLTL